MSDPNNELEKEFELERMILFSDAVFAIAITLLIIEIKFPDVPKGLSNYEMLLLFKPLLIDFFAFALSFFFIGVLWSRHLQLFKYIKTYNNKVIFHNLLFLFFVVCFPFSATALGHLRPSLMLPLYIYFVNLALVFFSQFLLCNYLFTSSNSHLTKSGHEDEKRYLLLRSKYFSFTLLATAGVVIATAIITDSNSTYVDASVYVMVFMILITTKRLKKLKPTTLKA